MLRKFNYTKRKKIPSDNIEIEVITLNENTYFNATLHTDNLDFPKDAKVFIEAHYGPDYRRFDFGKFSQIMQPNSTDITELKQISELIKFRIKVVDEETGMILGFANQINLADNEERAKSSIFFVNPVHMDTNEIWRLNFDLNADEGPILEINNSIDEIRDIARSNPTFLALVYPAAIRIILQKLIEEGNFDREGDSWTANWITFTEDILGIETTPEADDQDSQKKEWISDVVRAFNVRNKIFEQFTKTIN